MTPGLYDTVDKAINPHQDQNRQRRAREVSIKAPYIFVSMTHRPSISRPQKNPTCHDKQTCSFLITL